MPFNDITKLSLYKVQDSLVKDTQCTDYFVLSSMKTSQCRINDENQCLSNYRGRPSFSPLSMSPESFILMFTCKLHTCTATYYLVLQAYMPTFSYLLYHLIIAQPHLATISCYHLKPLSVSTFVFNPTATTSCYKLLPASTFDYNPTATFSNHIL